MTQRARIGAASKLWSTMNWDQRHAWDTFALSPPEVDVNAFGEDRVLTGFHWCLRIQARRALAGQAANLVPPAGTVPETCDIGLCDLEYTGNAMTDATLVRGVGDIPSTYYVAIEQIVSLKRGQMLKPGKYTMVCAKGRDGTYPSMVKFLAEFVAAFGHIAAPFLVWCKLRYQSPEGLRGQPALVQAQIEVSA
jgi:hypothetical protein